MAIYVRALTTEEKDLLHALAAEGDPTSRRWATLVLLSAEGRRVPEIARQVELSEVQVRLRIKEFNHRGEHALQRRPSPGRPRKISETLGRRLAWLMQEKEPRDFGLGQTGWTLDLLVVAAELQGWVSSISHEGVRLALQKAKLPYHLLKRQRRPRNAQRKIRR